MARSRRSRRTRGGDAGGTGRTRRGSRAASRAESSYDEEEEILSDSAIEELTEDDSADTYESVNSARGSSSRMGRASSRRTRASGRSKSSRKSKRASRTALTPEERAERRRKRLALIKVLVTIVILGGIAAGLIYINRPDPVRERMQGNLKTAERLVENLKDRIRAGNIERAEELIPQIEELVQEQDYALADPPWPQRAAAIREQVADDLQIDLQLARERHAAERNLASIKGRLGAMTGDPDVDLNQLLLDVTAFKSNPVDLQGVPLEHAERRFKSMIMQLTGAEARIRTESERRGDTSAIENQASVQITNLITQRKFKRAYEVLERFEAEHADADFSRIEGLLDESAERAWNAINTTVRELVASARQSGASAEMREQNLRKARDLLQGVIADYNDTYARQARDLMDELGL
ncbi:MAG: hypothetical protein ACOCXJ_04365 [Planctomycetota bacterium]